MRPRVILKSHLKCTLEIGDQTLLVDPDPFDLPDRCTPGWILLTGSSPFTVSVEARQKLMHSFQDAVIYAPEWLVLEMRVLSPDFQRLQIANGHWETCAEGLRIYAVGDSVHPNIAGYVVEMPQGRLYVSGYKAPHKDLVSQLERIGAISSMLIPVDDQNRVVAGSSGCMFFTVREAIALAKVLHVEQLAIQLGETVSEDELRYFHQISNCNAKLLPNPRDFYIGRPGVSVIIRTLNEARYLEELLSGIAQQNIGLLDCEVVLVDSGSTDQTVTIAQKYGCRILHIERERFSFGRSLNIGCEAARGEILVITSGHCVPVNQDWLQKLCQPLLDGRAEYSYGKQVGGPASQYSECRVFEKYFPDISQIPQQGFYCNNANSALLKSVWNEYKFDEELTGLEDMDLAKRMVRDGGRVAYIAEAPVYHYHSETWSQVRRRFEREAIALQQIKPNIHVSLLDAINYTLSSIWRDSVNAQREGFLFKNFLNIVLYRYLQYSGSYRGNQQHRKLSHDEKDQYFYPH